LGCFFGEFPELGRPANRRLGEVDGELIDSLCTIREDIMSLGIFESALIMTHGLGSLFDEFRPLDELQGGGRL
jgi:hypothetical protein